MAQIYLFPEVYRRGVVMKWGGTSVVTAQQDDMVIDALVEAHSRVPNRGHTVGVVSGQGKIDDTPEGKKATEHMYDIVDGRNPQEAWKIFRENTEQNMVDHGFGAGQMNPVMILLGDVEQILESGNIDAQAKPRIIGLPELVKAQIIYQKAKRSHPDIEFFTPKGLYGMIGEFDDSTHEPAFGGPFIDVPIDHDQSLRFMGKQGMNMQGKIGILPGFVGNTWQNWRLLTLERGSSDATATYAGAALDLDEIIIFSDREGILPVDPRVVAGLKHLDELSYEEARVFAGLGADIIQQVAIRPAEEFRIPIYIRPSNNPGKRGTRIGVCAPSLNHCGVKAIAKQSDYTSIFVKGFRERAGAGAEVDGIFAKYGVNVAHMRDGTGCRRYAIKTKDLSGELLEELASDGRQTTTTAPVSRITLVGAGIGLYQALNPRAGARDIFVSTLVENDIPHKVYDRDDEDIGITTFVHKQHEGLALRKLADAFGFKEIDYAA